MDLEMLREVVPMLRQQLEKSMLDRNYVQLERVTFSSILDVSTPIKNINIFNYRIPFNNILTQQEEKFVSLNWLLQQRIERWNF